MEIIYTGNSTNLQIISAAIKEDADVVGVNSLGGAHLSLGKDLIDIAASEGILDSKVFLIGGIIPYGGIKKLIEIGFDSVYTSDAVDDCSNYFKKT